MYWNNVNEVLPPIDQPCFLWDGRRMWIGARTFDASNCVWAWSNSYGGVEWNRSAWNMDHTVVRDYRPTHWMPFPTAPRFMTDAAIFQKIEDGANGHFVSVEEDSELAEALSLLRIRLPENSSSARVRAICCQLLEVRAVVQQMLANIPRHCRMSGVGPVLFSNQPAPPKPNAEDLGEDFEG